MEDSWLIMRVSQGYVHTSMIQQYLVYMLQPPPFSVNLLPYVTHAGHHCNDKFCKRTLVFDGNMKNHRDVCAAKEAGYAEYEGFPVKVKTGCTNTPMFQSRYCAAHSPTAFVSVGNSEVSSSALSIPAEKRLDQVAFILEKKVTRQTTFYKVELTNLL